MRLTPIALAALTASLALAACAGETADDQDEQNITAAECRATPGAPECQVHGTVVDGFIGELDPFVMGDICILFVQKDGSAKIYGLVEDFDLCSNTLRLGERLGAKVFFSKGEITYIADKESRDELKHYCDDAVYHYLEGNVHEADGTTDPGDAVANAISLYDGANPDLTTRVDLADIPAAPRASLELETAALAERFPDTDYEAEVEGYYAIHPAPGDDTIVAYAMYAWGSGEPDYHDWILVGVDLDGNVVHSDEDSG